VTPASAACSECRTLLGGYVLGAIEPDEADAVRRHLAECAECAIEHDERNVVVKADACNFCMACIPVCPTGSIDNWRIVTTPYSLGQQYDWSELPAHNDPGAPAVEATGAAAAALLADAHAGSEGAMRAPASAPKPTINLYTAAKPVEAVVQGTPSYAWNHRGLASRW